MDQKNVNFFTHNWHLKAVALFSAFLIWILVSHSITSTKTIANIPLRVINLPQDKTIIGLQANGYLAERISLTLNGAKEAIDDLDTGDLEVLLDASMVESNPWIVSITKKNLVSLNPSVDIFYSIYHISHSDLVIKFSDILTKKIPVTISAPTGHAPKGYIFLGIWPHELSQTMTGARESINGYQEQGLHITFDLDTITEQELNKLNSLHGDVINSIKYLVPKHLKKVQLPLNQNKPLQLNDPQANDLAIYFLKDAFLPLETYIPINIFYPFSTLKTLSPTTLTLLENKWVKHMSGMDYFTSPVYLQGISQNFLDVIKEHIRIILVADPQGENQELSVSLEVVDPESLREIYVKKLLKNKKDASKKNLYSKRFDIFLNSLHLVNKNGHPIELKVHVRENKIELFPS
jgi:hypothetical protein